MKWEVFDIKGEKLREIDLLRAIYDVPMNEAVLHQVLKAYAANRRQGTHATRTRSLVSGGGKKPFKQKGTGNARQGSTRSPLMPGGGVSHGPQPRDYTQRLNRKLKILALKIALSDKLRHKKLIIVDNFQIQEYSTKKMLSPLKTFSLNETVLFADERKDAFLYRSVRNIHGVDACSSVMNLNAEDVLRSKSLILSEAAVRSLAARLRKEAS